MSIKAGVAGINLMKLEEKFETGDICPVISGFAFFFPFCNLHLKKKCLIAKVLNLFPQFYFIFSQFANSLTQFDFECHYFRHPV